MRSRSALLITAAMSLVLAAFLVPLAVLVRNSAADRAVSAATVRAQALGTVVATADPRALRLSVEQANADSRYPITVYLPDGGTVGAAAPRTAAVRLASRGGGSLVVVGATGWEVLVAVESAASGTAVVRAFVSDAELSRGVHRAWLILTVLGIGLLALAVAAGDWLTRAVLAPIRDLATVSHALAGGDLTARTRPHGPAEVRAVAAGLNHLAGQIEELLRQERESVADLSHQLRTPLTALRLEVDALPAAAGLAGHVAALETAVTGVIEQIRRSGGAGPDRCDAAAVLAERCRFWAVLAGDQHRAFHQRLADQPVPVAVGENTLRACLDALLGNVFAHTPVGTAFGVRLSARRGGGAVLVVSDEGPGFGTGDPLARGASGAGSTGLGLDIARSAARASGGELSLGPAGPGATVTVELGAP